MRSLLSGVHLADFAHETAASLVYHAVTRQTSGGLARAFPASPVFMSEAELLRDFAAVFVSDNDFLIDDVVTAECLTNPKRTAHHDFVLKNHELPAEACEAGEAVKCDGGWTGPRGFVLNAFHTTQSPKHSGLHFVGQPCGQRASRSIFEYQTRRGRCEPDIGANSCFCTRTSTGNCTSRLEVMDADSERARQAQTSERPVGLSHERAQPRSDRHLAGQRQGTAAAPDHPAPRSGTGATSKIAITGLRVLEAEIGSAPEARDGRYVSN